MNNVIISEYILKERDLISFDTVFVNLLKRTGISSYSIGYARIWSIIGFTTRFSMNWSKEFMNWEAPLKLLASQASSIADIV